MSFCFSNVLSSSNSEKTGLGFFAAALFDIIIFAWVNASSLLTPHVVL